MSTDIVKISNKSYSIPQSIEARARRRTYFNTYKEDKRSGDGELIPEESQVLNDLGIGRSQIREAIYGKKSNG